MSNTIDCGVVKKIATLSRITVPDDQLATYSDQLGSILEYFNKLNELDTENVEPMSHALDITNVLSEDTLGESLTPEQATRNAPERDGDFFMVPKVIGDSQ